MNSPIIPAITACFEKAVSVALDVNNSATRKEQFVSTLRSVFRQELTTLRNALMAEETSRKVAVAELRSTLLEAIDDAHAASYNRADGETVAAAFWKTVGPWLERLEY